MSPFTLPPPPQHRVMQFAGACEAAMLDLSDQSALGVHRFAYIDTLPLRADGRPFSKGTKMTR